MVASGDKSIVFLGDLLVKQWLACQFYILMMLLGIITFFLLDQERKPII